MVNLRSLVTKAKKEMYKTYIGVSCLPNYSRAPTSGDTVRAVYHYPKKILKLKKCTVCKFQNARQVRMGHNMCHLLFICDIYCSLFLYCATLTDVFLCFFFSRKANARV
jgi:hypothetical protein